MPEPTIFAELITTSVAPVTVNASIQPSLAYTDNNLLGYCYATDFDGDNVSYNYKWYKNGIENISFDAIDGYV